MLQACQSSEPPVLKTDTCQPWAVYQAGALLLTNNTWGAQKLPDYKQCITVEKSTTKVVFGWSWHWQGKNDAVKAYPSITYGHKPWQQTSTTIRLPALVGTLPRLQVKYDLLTEATGVYNVLLEAWITNTATPRPDNRVAELAIHLGQHNWPGMPGKRIKRIMIGAHSYDFYYEPSMVVPGDTHRWAYLGFVYAGNEPAVSFQGQLDVKAFIHYLVQHGYLQTTHYISSIELGNEIINGEGRSRLNEFHVTF